MIGATLQSRSVLREDFGDNAGKARLAKAKTTNPFSIRLSDDERAFLKERAGNQPLAAYIRKIQLG